MNQQIRERALRAMTGALLSSDLTPAEIREIAQSFRTDPSLGEQIGLLVEVIVANLHASSREPKRTHSKIISDAAHRAGQRLNIAQSETFSRAAERSMLPKEDVLHRLQSYAQSPDWDPNPEWPLQKMWEEFVKVAPASSLQPAILAIQAGPVKPDPYVELIMSKEQSSNTAKGGAGFMQPGKPGISIGSGKRSNLAPGRKSNNMTRRKAGNG